MTAPTGRQLVLNRIGLCVVAVTFLGGIVSAWEWNRQTECMRTYVERNAQVSIALREAAQEDRKANDGMAQGFLQAKTSADARATLETYLRTRAEADKKRSENPVPPPPSQLCG